MHFWTRSVARLSEICLIVSNIVFVSRFTDMDVVFAFGAVNMPIWKLLSQFFLE